MSDKELLEMAAKAAGLNIVFKRWSGFYRSGCLSIRGEWTSRERSFVESKEWNPLTDDGDALRLAVKLKFNIEWDFNEVSVNYTAAEFEGDDPYAATRRAIVRAAADIGKGGR